MRRRHVGNGGRLLALVCAIACFAPATHAASRRQRPTKSRAGKRVRVSSPEQAGTGGTFEEHVHVRRGDTLESLLAARGVGASEARPWLAAATGVYDLRRLRPRHGLTLRFDRSTHALEAVHYEMDARSLLVFERSGDAIRAERAPLPYFIEVKGAACRIDRGLREDARAANIPEGVVSALADIFGWELDAFELRPGDAVRVLYENTWQTGGARPEPGNVVGAEIVSGRRTLTAVFFEDDDGNGAYYTPTGEPLSRAFLRYPLEFTDITSEFSLLRDHPILHRSRPHLGVDFAAPRWTPVRAVASGWVSEAGWAGELGRCVRVQHAGDLTSVYGHLSRLADGLRDGVRVERGQVVGYVGSTGLSTGPHLHFALGRDGEYVDPMTFHAAPVAPVADAARRTFDRIQLAVTHQLAALPESGRPLTVSLSTSSYRPE